MSAENGGSPLVVTTDLRKDNIELELSSTMGSEIREPRRILPRSIYLAAPAVALIYILGTCSMIWLVPREQINVVAGPLQAISNGMAGFGGNAWLVVSLVALLLAVARVGGVGAWLTGSARVAFVVRIRPIFPGRVRAGSPALAHPLRGDPGPGFGSSNVSASFCSG
jgi:amino acid transporter